MTSDRDIKIAATVLNAAGATISEVGKALKLHQGYVHESSKQRHTPVKFHSDTPSPRSARWVPEYPGGDHSLRSPSEVSKYDQRVTYLKNIGGLHPSKMILITGVPLQNASRFSVYLQRGDSFFPQQIAMVFDVRFKWGSPVSQNCVVLNHKEGHWDEKLEERNTSCFPFKRGTEFEILILVEDSCFKIAVNDKHFTEFNHRIDPGRIDTLRIEGDVKVTTVQYQE